MGGIFVSYRRSDSQGEAGRLFDDLVTHFGEDTVFMDVAAIEAGRDFRKAIEEGVTKCGVLLVVIGLEWLDAKDERGARRLNDPSDFVRIETASALRRDIPVIPVLVRGAKMPSAEQLPDELKELAFRNCIELTHARWRSDIQLLTESLRRSLGDTGKVASAKGSTEPGTRQTGVTPSSKLDAKSLLIDPADVQGVIEDLALRIGPIAGVVVRRAAPSCSSIDDLYLKVAEEIDSPDEREKFLLSRAPISAPARRNKAQPAAAATIQANASPTASGSPPVRDEAAPNKAAPAPLASSPNRRRYLLFAIAGAVFLVLIVALAVHFASSKGAGAPRAASSSAREAHEAASTPATNGSRASAETPRDHLKPVASPAKQADARSESASPERIRLSEETSKSLLIKMVQPVYPILARQGHVQGMVVLDADIGKDGTVENLRPISGHPILVPAAIDAIKQSRYKPYLQNGNPVAVSTQISVNFILSDQ